MDSIGIQNFGAFVVTCLLINITPGQDTFYILGRSLSQGRAAGVASALGIGTGALIHTLLAALGLSSVLAASASAFLIVKLAGAAYLIWLGIKMLIAPAPVQETGVMPAESVSFWPAFRQGMWTNLMNPKVALFFLALMPQFIAAGSESTFMAFLLLGLTFVITGTLWCLGLAWCAASLGGGLRGNGAVAKWLNRSAGALFVCLGLRLAVSK